MAILRVTYTFTVPDNSDADAAAEEIFDRLCDLPNAPYESSDGFDSVWLDGERVS